MSSATHIARTRFQTLGMDGAVLYTTYGARVYDDHESAMSISSIAWTS